MKILLLWTPLTSLLAYDLIEVQPRLGQIEALLRSAPTQDALPPPAIRRLIDNLPGAPNAHATRLVVGHLFPVTGTIRTQLREVLWRILLPLHVGESGMYGLYATFAFNGTGYGLSDFARREYGKPLDALSPMQAATTVAVTRGVYLLRRRELLGRRVKVMPRLTMQAEAASHAKADPASSSPSQTRPAASGTADSV